jgi:hypothetical protein
MRSSTTRREFLARAAGFSLGAIPLARALESRAPFVVRLGIIAGADARADGALLGVEEARHAAALFGGEITLTTIAPNAPLPPDLTAILGDADLAHARRLLHDASLSGALFMNVACTSDDLRGRECSAAAFHVAPSDAMRRDAAGDAGGDVVAWDASLEKFGADTLNERFHTRFGRPMSADAWCAWVAVKALWESALRVKSGEARRIAEYLARDTTQFDGHKGRPLSFRTWDHQLRQPLYVKRGTMIVEVPAPASPDESSRELLDRLGTRAAQSPCRMAP